MSIKPQFATENYIKREGCVTAQSIVECRFARSDDLADVIAVSAQVTPADCTASSGRINYGGRLVCTIVYVDDGGKLCRVQKGAEFAHFVDGENFAAAQSCLCKLSCLKTQLKREGTSLIVSAVIGAEITLFVKAERAPLIACDGAVCRKQSVTAVSYSLFSGESEVEDEFEAEGVADVLIPSATPLVYSCECRADVIEINGEIALSLLAVRGDSPVALERVVPFKAEIPSDEAVYGGSAACSAAIGDLTVTARVDEERGKCEISCTAALIFDGYFAEESEQEVICDLFSTQNALEVTRERAEYSRVTGVESLSRRISSAAAVKAKLDFACAFKAVALPSCEFTYNAESGGLEGAVNAVLIYEQSGELRSTQVTIPFTVAMESAEDCEIAVCGVSVRQRAEGECEGEAVLKIARRVRENADYDVVTAVSEGAPLPQNDSAVTVYIPTAGDGAWETCKKLLMDEKELLACNPSLKFPLSGGERVTVYRQKRA